MQFNGNFIYICNKCYFCVGNAPEPPRISFEPAYVTVTEGDPIEIRCLAAGNPQPTLEWSGGPNNPDVSTPIQKIFKTLFHF